MKKGSLLLSILLPSAILVACTANSPSPTNDASLIATTVAATLSAYPTATFQPAAPAAAGPSLADFTDKVLVGEDDAYAVYLINSNGADPMNATGAIIVYAKAAKLVYPVTGSFIFGGATIVSHDPAGKYVLLSNGTSTTRKTTVVSLTDLKQAVKDFCISSGTSLFWNDFLIFDNCETFSNRPWGAGEAPGITAIDLKTGLTTDIAKSDLTHQYAVKTITANTLQYAETSVKSETDWQDPNSQATTLQSYDLSALGK